MCEVHFEIPDASASALLVTRDGVGAEVRLLAAMKAYEMRRLSSGAAAELAGIGKVEFLQRLKDYDIDAFRISPEDFAQDQATLERSLRG
jgi:predicted HTH domain antitoxin